MGRRSLLRSGRLFGPAKPWHMEPMISVIIPTLNSEADLSGTLAALIPAAVEGLVREVIIVDGGSKDRTLLIAENSGAEIVTGPAGRGAQLKAGAARARQPWLLFLHADTELSPNWDQIASHFMEKVDRERVAPSAAAFRFRLMDEGWQPRALEAAVGVRCALFKAPYGDQGLLIPRSLYDQVGGYAAHPLMEDVDMVRKLGRKRITMLRAEASTSARRYRTDGYVQRTALNLFCLMAYLAGMSPERIRRIYDGKSEPVGSAIAQRAGGTP